MRPRDWSFPWSSWSGWRRACCHIAEPWRTSARGRSGPCGRHALPRGRGGSRKRCVWQRRAGCWRRRRCRRRVIGPGRRSTGVARRRSRSAPALRGRNRRLQPDGEGRRRGDRRLRGPGREAPDRRLRRAGARVSASPADLAREAEAARAEFLEVFAGLTPAQRGAPTLVGEWGVREILAHMGYWSGNVAEALHHAEQGRAHEFGADDLGVEDRNAVVARVARETDLAT